MGVRGLVAAASAVMLCNAGVAVAQPPRTETRVASAAADRALVAESYVSLLRPAPAEFGPRPAACDRIGYLRFRSTRGPRSYRRADAILVGMPGLNGGATLMEQVARNTIRRSARRGRKVEFWSLDRRANCLEDHRGFRAALRAKDPDLAADYYFGGKPIGGHRYAGPPDAGAKAFLSHIGLAQTLQDWMAVIRQVPARQRARKVLCGGHSLGSRLTGAFSDWDFDGDPATTADAGFRQCAAFFSIDQRLREEATLAPLGPAFGVGTASGGAAGSAPYAEPLADPFIALGTAAVAAQVAPRGESDLGAKLPQDGSIELLLRALLSPDAASAATGTRQVRDFRFTNTAALGAIYDDNSQALGILRVSIGAFAGGPVTRREFPTPDGFANGGGVIGGNTLVAPAKTRDEGGPLYRWTRSDRITSDPVDDQGRAYTSRAGEITDVRDLARLTAESPADFWEWYFPTRVTDEAVAEAAGDKSGDLAAARYDGKLEKPALYIDAGEGVEGDKTDTPAGPPGTRRIVLPGYNHIDPSTATFRQAGGKPERASLALARFIVAMTRR